MTIKQTPVSRFAHGYAFPLVLSLLYVFFAVRSGTGAPFWFDEIASILLLRDPSLSHMLEANRDNINVVPPLYFLLGWGYVRAFGTSELALRGLSGLFLILTVWVAWFFLRRRFSLSATIVAMTAVFLSHLLLIRGYEVRYYSFYLLICLLAVISYDNVARKARVGNVDMAWLFLTQLLVCFTHLFGLFVGGCILLADVGTRYARTRSLKGSLNFRIIGPVLLAWLLFVVLWGAAFRSQSAAFSGYLWIDRPNIPNAIRFLFGNSLTIMGAAMLLLLANLAAYRGGWARAILANAGDRMPLLVLSALLVTVPLAIVYVFSTVSSFSGFLFRYMYYVFVAWLVLLAFGTDLLLRRFDERQAFRAVGDRFATPGWAKAVTVGALVASALLVGLSVKRAAAGPVFEKPNDWVEAQLRLVRAPEGLPLLITDQQIYHHATYYAPKPTRYFFPMDREYAIASGPGAGFNVVTSVIQEAVVRNYPDPNTQPWEAFVAAHPRFLVLDFNAHGTPRWPEYRLKNDPRFRVTTLDTNGNVLLAERVDTP